MSFQLSSEDREGLSLFLRDYGLFEASETVSSLTTAGAGNMNCTLRAKSASRSLIVKQSRPYVEKYPQIAAPLNRTLMEAKFYEAPHSAVVKAAMPRLLAVIPESHVLVLEDLGSAEDLTTLYSGEILSTDEIRFLIEFLRHLHHTPVPHPQHFENREMRELNAQHIFQIPLLPENHLDLDSITPGLKLAGGKLVKDSHFCAAVRTLGEIYLGQVPTKTQSLLHGDFYPGSWLKVGNFLKVIDPEFCFIGPPEFDFGVMLAHLFLAKQPTASIDDFLHTVATDSGGLDLGLIHGFAGVEIMRRLIGVAQLPVQLPLTEKENLLEISTHFVLEGPH